MTINKGGLDRQGWHKQIAIAGRSLSCVLTLGGLGPITSVLLLLGLSF